MTRRKMTYKDSGVDIRAGDLFVEKIAPMVKNTFGPEVVTDIGGFGGLFAPDLAGYREPVLVSGTDGVGTKLKLAFLTGRHDTVGIDLVAMCVNDILVSGARPLFFLDYFATAKLEVEKSADVVRGIVAGCREAGCALIGGETAEMPDFYAREEYDLAGFAVGIVDRSSIIDGSTIEAGDQIIGLASSGLHSNGYSLVRKIVLDLLKLDINQVIPPFDRALGEVLLEPTRIYVRPLLSLMKTQTIKGIAHITGGGIPGNLNRILPQGCSARIQKNRWEAPPVFGFLASKGEIDEEEMFRTFNMGIGMSLVVPPAEAESVLQALKQLGEKAWLIGHISEGSQEVVIE